VRMRSIPLTSVLFAGYGVKRATEQVRSTR